MPLRTEGAVSRSVAWAAITVAFIAVGLIAVAFTVGCARAWQ
jgi:hypothetical protein